MKSLKKNLALKIMILHLFHDPKKEYTGQLGVKGVYVV